MRRAISVGTLLSLVLALVMWLPASGQDPNAKLTFTEYPEITARNYLCHRAGKPPRIDGKLDDEAWVKAPWSEAFGDIEGDRKPKPRQRTRMKMLWDDQNLYIAAQIDEAHIWGNLTQHDSVIFQDNDFEVFLDPDGDSHLYAEMEMNALNTTWDLLLTRPYKDGGKAIDSWEIPGLKTAVHIDGTINDPSDTDRGWSVEIAWPWKSLAEISYVPVPPREGDRWRANFSRVEWQVEIVEGKYRKIKGKPEDNWIWSPQGVIDMHRPERWGTVVFTKAEPGSATQSASADPEAMARYLLHRVYYAQRDYQKVRGRWATQLDQLNLNSPAFRDVRLENSFADYQVSTPSSDGKSRWRLGPDARIWRGQ